MSKESARWAKIRAAFEAGKALGKIAKDYGVSIAELLTRAKAEGWQRVTDKPPLLELAPPPKSEAEQVTERVDQAAQEIIAEHRNRARAHRDTYDRLVAEFQAMLGHLVSFLDPEQIAKIKAAEPGTQIETLTDMLKAVALKFGLFERLSNMLVTVVDLERRVWGLNATDDAPQAVQWDDLLAKVREPSRPRPLPDNVVKFDRQLAQRPKA